MDKAFEPFTPKFFYKLIQLNDYSVKELVEKNDELSLLMLINRLQSTEAFRELNLPENYLKNKGVEDSVFGMMRIKRLPA